MDGKELHQKCVDAINASSAGRIFWKNSFDGVSEDTFKEFYDAAVTFDADPENDGQPTLDDIERVCLTSGYTGIPSEPEMEALPEPEAVPEGTPEPVPETLSEPTPEPVPEPTTDISALMG